MFRRCREAAESLLKGSLRDVDELEEMGVVEGMTRVAQGVRVLILGSKAHLLNAMGATQVWAAEAYGTGYVRHPSQKALSSSIAVLGEPWLAKLFWQLALWEP